MAWFWATSIVYTYRADLLSGELEEPPSLNWLQYVFLCNPITPIVMTFQRAIYGSDRSTPTRARCTTCSPPGGWAPTRPWSASVLAVSIGLFLLALIVFGRLEGNFAEEL